MMMAKQTQEKQLSANGATKDFSKGATKDVSNTGDTIIDATLKAIGEKAPPLPAHILNTMHSNTNNEKKPQAAKGLSEDIKHAPQIKTEQEPGISATPDHTTPPVGQKPAVKAAQYTNNTNPFQPL